MNIETKVRSASKGDIEIICEMWSEMIDFHAVRDKNFLRSEDGKKNFGNYISSCLEQEDAKVLVAESKGVISGYCLGLISKNPPVYERKEFGLVCDLAVTEQWRNKGIGKALFKKLMAWFQSRGIERIELEVAISNEISQRFWKNLGFKTYMKKLYIESQQASSLNSEKATPSLH